MFFSFSLILLDESHEFITLLSFCWMSCNCRRATLKYHTHSLYSHSRIHIHLVGVDCLPSIIRLFFVLFRFVSLFPSFLSFSLRERSYLIWCIRARLSSLTFTICLSFLSSSLHSTPSNIHKNTHAITHTQRIHYITLRELCFNRSFYSSRKEELHWSKIKYDCKPLFRGSTYFLRYQWRFMYKYTKTSNPDVQNEIFLFLDSTFLIFFFILSFIRCDYFSVLSPEFHFCMKQCNERYHKYVTRRPFYFFSSFFPRVCVRMYVFACEKD